LLACTKLAARFVGAILYLLLRCASTRSNSRDSEGSQTPGGASMMIRRNLASSRGRMTTVVYPSLG
jgi:hypothetical protein